MENPRAFPSDRALGMNLRDYFAAHALEGLWVKTGLPGVEKHQLAALAYEMADAMLAVREETKPKGIVDDPGKGVG